MNPEALILQRLAGIGLVGVLGIELSFEEGHSRCRMTVDDRHGGAPGIAHGGAIATLLDTALGVEALRHALASGHGTSTVEMKVNFVRRATLGSRLWTESRIDHAGRSLLVVSGRAIDEAKGETVALAMGTFNLFELPGGLPGSAT